MSDFLGYLVERSVTEPISVRPELGSIYEPPAQNDSELIEAAEPRRTPSRDVRPPQVRTLEAPQSASRVESPSKQPVISNPRLQPPAPQLVTATRIDNTAAATRARTEEKAEIDPLEPTPRPAATVPIPAAAEPGRVATVLEFIRREAPRSAQPIRTSPLRALTSPPIAPLPRFHAAERTLTQNAPPSVHVTIGRVEVRATVPRSNPPAERPRGAAPTRGLDEYLRERAAGRP